MDGGVGAFPPLLARLRQPAHSRFTLALAVAAALLAAAIVWASEVDDHLSTSDVRFIRLVLDPLGIRRGAFADPSSVPFHLQIKAIRAIQQAVLTIAPKDRGIPLDQLREPVDLARAGAGLCFDRSRSIEKFLRYAGFETRHASLYADRLAGPRFLALLVPGIPSHAVSEVKTSRGWMVVDSNVAWVGLGPGDRPLALHDLLQAVDDGVPPAVRRKGAFARVPIEHDPFFYVYGLYSRHGRFYPPFAPIPDVNWPELLGNIAA